MAVVALVGEFNYFVASSRRGEPNGLLFPSLWSFEQSQTMKNLHPKFKFSSVLLAINEIDQFN